jgi:3-hydroxyisobutyrate dehydrogenase
MVNDCRIGFIGLGNVGGKLAGSLLRHGMDLTVRDLDEDRVAAFVANGAMRGTCPREIAERVDLVITCLPSPQASADVMERPDGILAGLSPGKIWLEMSTTDPAEIRRLAAKDPAYRTGRIGLDPQGHHQLSVHGASCGTRRGTVGRQGRGYGHEHDL